MKISIIYYLLFIIYYLTQKLHLVCRLSKRCGLIRNNFHKKNRIIVEAARNACPFVLYLLKTVIQNQNFNQNQLKHAVV